METKNEQLTDNRKEAYEAPKCEIIEMQNEGVLCASAIHEGYTYDNNGVTWY